jgi:hypothetical protein
LDEKDRSILSRDSKYCLVGEAWGFTGKQAGYYIGPLIPFIGCWTCIKYGKRFGKISKDNDSNINNFEQLISEFLTHWNQKHKTVTAKFLNMKLTYIGFELHLNAETNYSM